MNLSPTVRRWLPRAAKAVALALLVWGFHATLRRALVELERPEFREHLPRLQGKWLALSGILYLIGMLPGALFFTRLMRACGQPASPFALVRAFYISQVGKYVPGKAMVIVLRAALLATPGVQRTVVAAAVFIDTLTLMAAGALAALVALAPDGRRQATALAAAAGMFAITAIPAQPPIFVRLARMAGLGRWNPAAVDRLRLAPRGVLAFGWVACSVGWWIQGLSLWAALRAIGATQAGPLAAWPLHTAAAGLSVVAGFLTMIPAGFVGRELVLTELMAPAYGAAEAALAALLVRLVWLVSEALVSAILYFAGGRGPTSPPGRAADP